MTAVETDFVRSKGRSSPHGVKLWQLNSTAYQSSVMEDGSLVAAETRFSAWTPICNKPSNQQLFQERTTLILHWFDMWTDRQRKQFIHSILTRCSKSQLNFTRDWFLERVPIIHLDFTTVLPRFLSLYILSYLNPQDLCQASQVSWHWKLLAEQDCLWAPKCMMRGWFLPYTPGDCEYGAWKRHYVACVGSLDYLTPREAAATYGTLNQALGDEKEEEEERKRERLVRQAIREKVVEHKRATLKSRRPWLSNSWTPGTPVDRQRSSMSQPGLTAALVLIGEKSHAQSSVSQLLVQEAHRCSANDSALQKSRVTSALRSLPKGRGICGSSYPMSIRQLQSRQHSSVCQPPLHLLLVSSRVPAYELVLCGARGGVVPVLYDSSGTTLETLLYRTEKALQGQRAQSVAILAEGGAGEIRLMQDCRITEKTVLNSDIREFWEKLSVLVVPPAEGGRLDIFVPLAASVTGMELISKLSSLTGLDVSAPTGTATGSYQHILSEWSGQSAFPPRVYLGEAQLLGWCRQAEWLQESLAAMRVQLRPQLQQLSEETRGRALGQFLSDVVGLSKIHVKSEDPVKFLSEFLQGRCEEGSVEHSNRTFLVEGDSNSPISGIPQQGVGGSMDRRMTLAEELLHSEEVYVQFLQAVVRVYADPLKAALNSNRAILSSANFLMVFSPVLDILEVNSLFLEGVAERLKEWGPSQCLGDVFLRLCSKLRTYTNFFNNYPTVLRTIDKCREMTPAFRAFLKRHDRTLATSMLSLQELLLLPSVRIEEYVSLLESLFLVTTQKHPDHLHLRSALDTLSQYRSFLHKLKKNTDGDTRILEVQRRIQSCPNLQEGNRHLITVQEVGLLHSPDEDITASLRVYEHVGDLGLFLFNDALVLSERSVSHRPFSRSCSSTHTFLASVALHTLSVLDITDTKYVRNAFALEGPKRRWVCATDREEEKVTWLSALQRAINAAIGDR
ncbi:hypothetical protein AGOR_G00108630 [Albula goreensis]|uniref:Epithelial cell-transforming sequence 2 oncogene-like n=1 Tax=Albula goreensis TaxID=1534307 RepID=A0A8T3DGZ9_9TELE|nr:hypothetical protein AGOR_G00108630 [Albula goreensis]